MKSHFMKQRPEVRRSHLRQKASKYVSNTSSFDYPEEEDMFPVISIYNLMLLCVFQTADQKTKVRMIIGISYMGACFLAAIRCFTFSSSMKRIFRVNNKFVFFLENNPSNGLGNSAMNGTMPTASEFSDEYVTKLHSIPPFFDFSVLHEETSMRMRNLSFSEKRLDMNVSNVSDGMGNETGHTPTFSAGEFTNECYCKNTQ